VEVAPTAHYGMGGVRVDDDGETDVDGLYAIGETMVGVHGANRLGGNSLAETVAYGTVAGEAIAERLTAPETRSRRGPSDVLDSLARHHLADLVDLADSDGEHDPAVLIDELRTLLQDRAGILRDEDGLREGLERLDRIRTRARDMAVGDRTSRSYEFALNLGFGLVAADGLLRGARRRTESRGAHYRTDFPETDPLWRCNVVVRRDSVGAMELLDAPVGTPSDEVQAALEADHELDYHQLE
jgi:succinate dehydrogenase / fumarate reductase flavoprotein subunit